MKKKWLYIIGIIVLVVPVLFFYHAFNGNPVWKAVSTNALKNYLKDTYPQDEFRIHDGFYNFKISGYTYEVIKIGEDGQGYEFEVTRFFKPTVSYDGIYYANLDLPLMEKLQDEAANEISDALNMDSIVNIGVQIEVLQGTYDADTQWSKDLQLEKPIYIHLTMDVTNMSKEEVFTAVQSIKQKLDSAGYQYDRVSFNGNMFDGKFGDKDEFGYLKYAVGFDQDSNITIKNIEEYNQ
ncbi:YfjL-like protein [Pseudogracilibacillus auburnensis]|uniref:YfjL-like protein n=1 Tax=Pseudogracilibacillus auburnensis TaxID=1494959 RepID=UPI001A967FF3|nr:hypothetical protein [Pseudogracilibacillus auburnensis]MBO1003960.1 hypothetical protein [Pseudogracilibacillus auburnensis]